MIHDTPSERCVDNIFVFSDIGTSSSEKTKKRIKGLRAEIREGTMSSWTVAERFFLSFFFFPGSSSSLRFVSEYDTKLGISVTRAFGFSASAVETSFLQMCAYYVSEPPSTMNTSGTETLLARMRRALTTGSDSLS